MSLSRAGSPAMAEGARRTAAARTRAWRRLRRQQRLRARCPVLRRSPVSADGTRPDHGVHGRVLRHLDVRGGLVRLRRLLRGRLQLPGERQPDELRHRDGRSSAVPGHVDDAVGQPAHGQQRELVSDHVRREREEQDVPPEAHLHDEPVERVRLRRGLELRRRQPVLRRPGRGGRGHDVGRVLRDGRRGRRPRIRAPTSPSRRWAPCWCVSTA